MARQLQTSTAPWKGLQTVIEHEQGGTGEDNARAAVIGLGGIHTSQVNEANGIAGYNPITGKISASAFVEGDIDFFGFSIQGPSVLAHETTGEYRITDLSLKMEPEVSVSAGSLAIIGDRLFVTAPTSGDEVILTIGVRQIPIQLVEPGIAKPVTIYPVNGNNTPVDFIIRGGKFIAEPVSWTGWQDVVPSIEDGTFQAGFPDGATAFEVEGRAGENGSASFAYGNETFRLGNGLTSRIIQITDWTYFEAMVEAPGSMRFRSAMPAYRHIETDWDIATDPDFNNIIYHSYNDWEHLTELPVSLVPGTYYFRYRYIGEVPGTGGGHDMPS